MMWKRSSSTLSSSSPAISEAHQTGTRADALPAPRRQFQQRLECRLVELFRIVHQQVHFLPGECQLHHLGQDRLHLRLGHVQVLRDLAQYTGSIAGTTGGHHALHRLLVGAGHQRLAQQGLATTPGR